MGLVMGLNAGAEVAHLLLCGESVSAGAGGAENAAHLAA